MDQLVVEAAPQVRVAGFWRRLAALVIDLILLGIVGSILGVFMFDTLAELGGYGRVLGFVIALGYFGVMNSHIGDGQTLGKRALDIEVEGIDGQPLTLTRSLIRYAVLGIPFFLDYAPLNDGLLAGPVGYTVALLVFGGIFSIAESIHHRYPSGLRLRYRHRVAVADGKLPLRAGRSRFPMICSLDPVRHCGGPDRAARR